MADAEQKKMKSFREMRAERTNRLEASRLKARIKVMEREHSHSHYANFLQKKAILKHVEGIHRTTGYSPLSVRPERGDRALRESSYFTTGHKLSEKALNNWKLDELLLERELRISDDEMRKRADQQTALRTLLVDLGVVENRKGRLRSQSCPAPKAERQDSEEELPKRPVTASSRQLNASSLSVALPEAAVQRENSQLAREEVIVSRGKLQDKKSRIFNEQGEMIRKATIARPGDKKRQSETLSRTVTFEKEEEEEEEKKEEKEACADVAEDSETAASEEAVGELGMDVQPQWKRQLRYEAPPGVHVPRQVQAKVQLTVSRMNLKKELQQMMVVDRKLQRGRMRVSLG